MSYFIYSTETPIIFIHIPKTAGKSIISIFEKHFSFSQITNNRTTYNNFHSTLEDVENFVCFLKKPFCFTVVRDPWNRAISWFWFRKEVLRKGLKSIKAKKRLNKVKFDYDLILKEYLKMEEGFNEWVFSYYDCEWDYTWFKFKTNQSEWIKSKNLKIDKIVKFENLQQEFNNILYFKNLQLPFTNVGIQKEKNNYKEIYNSKTKKFIEKLFQEDIDNFKYSFKE